MTNKALKTIVLASASPRREELMRGLGLTFKIIPSEIDENESNAKSPEELVELLAFKKAEEIAQKIDYPAIVIGSDTTVVTDDTSLGKPVDYKDAARMLRLLSGKKHRVVSGIAIIDNQTKKISTKNVSSDVYFKELTEKEINNYIQTGEPMGKAGAYAIQGLASTFITHINGCYNNIVGLPVFMLAQMLKEFHVDILELNATNKNT